VRQYQSSIGETFQPITAGLLCPFTLTPALELTLPVVTVDFAANGPGITNAGMLALGEFIQHVFVYSDVFSSVLVVHQFKRVTEFISDTVYVSATNFKNATGFCGTFMAKVNGQLGEISWAE
tara:strand:+ start:1245 stop:1610 length:366 start_codon:yes stop_codon:yes gene_type:complete